ncbi:hypothetical protein TWF569_007438 [Orbilia oligospora]|uniref:Uncharacterized protein n=1 Tax=Orbilia oligospora TaxID=2813651 RepID=A0A7C8J229_ORBOL|nr:hypothetical protein TWF102_002208 [Orbilia oligospora]KAF3088450.1 hypothetical protein TWF103_001136 [Orbilia oligospora]KAF3092886.1 hypothetical protein TWF706_008878 [Orbilia oligospora]KAF3135632.1 hypothetical protein TWF594_008355 [Orbilia oligospora]KAF3143034.1 hypothetical protein TWF569_007438 [Orbilia oligospora]
MKFTLLSSGVIALTTIVPSISAHSFIYWAAGDADPNVQGWALGYRTTTPANGQGQLPFQRDVAVFSNPAVPCRAGKWRKTCEKRVYLPTGCGLSLFYINRYHESYNPNKDKPYKKSGGKKNDWYYMTKYVSNKPFIPIASEVEKLVQWQVKYTGKHSTNNYGSLKNQQLRVKLPDNMSCGGSYGGRNNICMIRCQNSAPNGPFGGCVPIQEVQPPPAPPAEIPHQEEPAPPPQENQQDADDYNGADNVQERYDYSY